MDSQRELSPPWIEFPYIRWLSDDWKVGLTGFYWWQLEAWFRALGQSARNDYRSKYAEPEGWHGFYEMIESGRLPDIAEAYGADPDAGFTRQFYADCGSDHEVVAHDPLERLVILMLREAVASHSNGIEIDDREPECPIHFVRGDERLRMNPLPKRLFVAFKDRVARMCGKEDYQGQGTFVASLNLADTSQKNYGEAKVSVVFGDSNLRLTIIDLTGP
jgi:hypothetical protein